MIDALSYRHWAVSAEFASNFGLLALRLLSEGKSITHLIRKLSQDDILDRYQSRLSASADGIVVNVEWNRDERLFVANTRNGQNVAMVPVQGALTKHGDLCSWGMRDLVAMIDRANRSTKVAGIVLDTESPGGTVDGTNELGLAVKSSKKPVVTFGDGMIASAAYWISSQSRHIMGNIHNPTEIGSIGTLYVHENYQAYIAKEIGTVEIIRAPQSVDKARINVIEPITDDQRAEIRAELKEITKQFISTVKKGRGDRLQTGEENIFTGKMYPAKEALELGMIDSLGTLQDAINKAGDLAIQSTIGSRAHSNTQMKFPKLSAIFSSQAWGKALSAFTDEDQPALEAAEKKVADMEAETAQLKDENQALKTKNSELEKNVTDLQGQVSTLEKEKSSLESEKKDLQAKLDKAPAGHATTAVTAGDPDPGKQEKSYRSAVDDEADQLAKISINSKSK